MKLHAVFIMLWVLVFVCPGGGRAQYFDERLGDDIMVWPECEDPADRAAAKSKIRVPLTSPYAVEVDMKQHFVELIDIRDDYHFNELHLGGARNIPYNQMLEADIGAEHPIVLYCGECCCPGIKAAAGALIRRGFKDVSVLRGGLKEIGNLVLWQAAEDIDRERLVDVGCSPARTAIEELQQKIELEQVFPIHFLLNKAVLRSYSIDTLKLAAKLMAEYPSIKLNVYGHTCALGGSEYNLRLSRSRAEAVKKYLVGRGIDHRRIGAKGFGDKKPVAANATEEGRERNRRVEFHWLAADAQDAGRSPQR